MYELTPEEIAMLKEMQQIFKQYPEFSPDETRRRGFSWKANTDSKIAKKIAKYNKLLKIRSFDGYSFYLLRLSYYEDRDKIFEFINESFKKFRDSRNFEPCEKFKRFESFVRCRKPYKLDESLLDWAFNEIKENRRFIEHCSVGIPTAEDTKDFYYWEY